MFVMQTSAVLQSRAHTHTEAQLTSFLGILLRVYWPLISNDLINQPLCHMHAQLETLSSSDLFSS